MVKFYKDSRGDLVAVVPKKVWDTREIEAKENNETFPQLRPIFTFVNLSEYPEKEEFVTADISLLREFVSEDEIEKKPIYVPFTRGREYGSDGEELKKHELSFVTSADEFLRLFNYPAS